MVTRSVSARAGIAAASALVLLLLAGCSGNNDPFAYAKVSGKVTYEDGSIIPTDNMKLSFVSETAAVGNKYPRPGTALVEGKTGEFGCPTSHTPFDGLVRGKHKVLILAGPGGPLPASLVPPEYADGKKTPLEVDTDNPASFNLKVHKPTGASSIKPTPASPAGRRR
jgi:hypothetical protein